VCDTAKFCNCEIAVRRVYRELRERNIPNLAAYDTAAKIYRMHHPEVSALEARYDIADWLDE
jgi:hypothetical protein